MGLWSFIKNVAAVVMAPIVVPAGAAIIKTMDLVEKLTSSSSAKQVDDIASVLKEYAQQYKKNAKETEEACKKNVSIYFNPLIEELRKDEKIAGSFGIDRINLRKDKLCSEIDGMVTDAIQLSFSLDNKECRAILHMSAGSDRNKKMEEFAKKTIRNARAKVADKVRQVMNEMTAEISDFLQKNVDDRERKVTSEERQFKEWQRNMENKTFDSERAQLPAIEKIYIIEQIENKIKTAA